MSRKITHLCSSTGGTVGRRGGRRFSSHCHSKMGSYQPEKKSLNLNSHLFQGDWPLPSSLPHAGSTTLATLKGSVSNQHVLFYKFKVKRVTGISGENRETQLLWQRGCCPPAAEQHLGRLRSHGGDPGASACSFSLPRRVLLAVYPVFSLLTVNLLLTLWQGAPADC